MSSAVLELNATTRLHPLGIGLSTTNLSRSIYCLIILAALLLPVTRASAAEPSVSADQGQVALWEGDDLVRCGMRGRTWSALAGSCYFPIDMDHPAGTYEVGRWRATGGMERGWIRVQAKDYGQQDIEFPDDRYVHPPPEDLAKHYGDQVLVKRVLHAKPTEAKFTLPLGKPADPMPQGGGFGVRRTFNGEPKNRHTGTDYPINLGAPTLAVADGKVVLTGDHFFAGTSVYVDHGLGLISMYFHLSEITAETGSDVSRGGTVGQVGSTGRSTGPHLHLGLRWLGARIDPEPLFNDPAQLPRLTE